MRSPWVYFGTQVQLLLFSSTLYCNYRPTNSSNLTTGCSQKLAGLEIRDAKYLAAWCVSHGGFPLQLSTGRFQLQHKPAQMERVRAYFICCGTLTHDAVYNHDIRVEGKLYRNCGEMYHPHTEYSQKRLFCAALNSWTGRLTVASCLQDGTAVQR